MHQYPTLAFIDQALGDRNPRFAERPDAADLEQLARQLVDEFWSDTVWLTGRVPEAAFRAVCSALERDRITQPRPVAIMVLSLPYETASIPAEPDRERSVVT